MDHGSTIVTSGEGPERGHKELVKEITGCMSPSDVMKTLLRVHARDIMLETVIEAVALRLESPSAEDEDDTESMKELREILERMSKSTTPCMLGIQYPLLTVALMDEGMHMRIEVLYRIRCRIR